MARSLRSNDAMSTPLSRTSLMPVRVSSTGALSFAVFGGRARHAPMPGPRSIPYL
jgi:hypothetical protein